MAKLHLYDNGFLISSSRTSFSYVEYGYAADKQEFEQTAKPWSKLSEQMGPCSESSSAPPLGGKDITRSPVQSMKDLEDHSKHSTDSSTRLTGHSLEEETTTFYKRATRYISDIWLLIQHY
ncbi:MAG: hypothetical protein ACFFBJ_06855 [Promethearchaeota archaeon]